ncbi:MAG: DUF2796 domain-containing protein [Burkholderiaceae bacterium]
MSAEVIGRSVIIATMLQYTLMQLSCVMKKPSPIPHLARLRALASLVGTLALCAQPAAAQQHAHTHGRMALDVAIDARSITLAIEAPLDGFLGFERAPRTDAERGRVADMLARLKAADRLFRPDPAAKCGLTKVGIDSPVLGPDDAGGEHQEHQEHQEEHGEHGEHAGHDEHDHRHAPADGGHADLDVDIVFTCADAAQARFIDVNLFGAFERIRVIDAQVAAPGGQFKRTLRPGASRLDLVP